MGCPATKRLSRRARAHLAHSPARIRARTTAVLALADAVQHSRQALPDRCQQLNIAHDRHYSLYHARRGVSFARVYRERAVAVLP